MEEWLVKISGVKSCGWFKMFDDGDLEKMVNGSGVVEELGGVG